MAKLQLSGIEEKIRDIYTVWKRIDTVDVKILEAISFLGPRNLALIARHLDLPATTVQYRVRRLLDNSLLFFHLNAYHTYMGLKKAVIFVNATPGYESLLLECLRKNDFWIFLCRIYGPYEGCAGTWTIPKENADEFIAYLESLRELGIAASYEINWTTCHEGIPVLSKWFSVVDKEWTFNWEEWVNEIAVIEGELPWTLEEPPDWPIKVDYEDLLILKELDIDGRQSFTDISKKVGLPLGVIKYHFTEHVAKRGLIEGYQVDIARFPILFSKYVFFRFKFDSHEKFKKFAISLHDKPFPIFLGKVLGENALVCQMYLPEYSEHRDIVHWVLTFHQGLCSSYPG